MRRYLVMVLLVFAFPVHALESLRIGSQVLVVGDSAARVRALLGKPSAHGQKSGNASKASSKSSTARKSKSSKSGTKDKGEKWQYWRDGHATTITMVDGKVAHIEDVAR
jgi:hypothetical protein